MCVWAWCEQYATGPSKHAPHTIPIIVGLFKQAQQQPRPLSFLQRRLNIGWGTARVGVGMGLAHELYVLLQAALLRRDCGDKMF